MNYPEETIFYVELYKTICVCFISLENNQDLKIISEAWSKEIDQDFAKQNWELVTIKVSSHNFEWL